MMKIEEFAKITMGQSPSSETYNFEKNGLPFFQGKADFGEIYPTAKIWCNTPKKIAEKNDILLSVRAPVGNVNLASERCCIGRGLASIRAIDEKCYYKYLYYLLISKFEELNSKATGSTFKAIGKDVLMSIKCEIPNLSNQKKISERLDKVYNFININKRQIELLDELIISQFIKMFGNPIINDKNLTMVKIEDIAKTGKNSIKAGPFGSSLKKEYYVKNGYKIYGQEQVIADDINFGDYYIDEEKFKELKACEIKENDILISLVGTYGKILIVPKKYEKGIINPRLMKISPDLDKVNPIFFKNLFYLMNSVTNNITHGGTMGILNVGIVKSMNIILPDIKLQNQFSKYVEQVDKQKKIYLDTLSKLEELREGLMNKYFN